MKKYFVIVLIFICTSLVVNAKSILGDFCYKEDGKTIVQIHLSNDGTFWMKDYEDGKNYSGTYEIAGELLPGYTLNITFIIDRVRHEGSIMWPTQGKWGINFDGMYFELCRPR